MDNNDYTTDEYEIIDVIVNELQAVATSRVAMAKLPTSSVLLVLLHALHLEIVEYPVLTENKYTEDDGVLLDAYINNVKYLVTKVNEDSDEQEDDNVVKLY